ncbi:MAG: orotate phosphoribosyltransferase [Endomicrobium sp.]|jgi:orotate phosphoribosyltransferase|nr:orotate phosphoribosyltransferase [Endomicrobium sp.]
MKMNIMKNKNNIFLFDGLKFGLMLQVGGIGPVSMLVFTLSLSIPVTEMLIGILGLSIVDLTYVSLAVFSISALVKKIQRYQRVFDIVIGIVLMAFGVFFITTGILFLKMFLMTGQIGYDFINPESIKGKTLFFGLMGLDMANPITILFIMGIFSLEVSKRDMKFKETSIFAAGFILATPVFMSFIILVGHFIGTFLPIWAVKTLNIIVGLVLGYWGVKNIFFKKANSDEKRIKEIEAEELIGLQELFKKNKALLIGHFKLASGLHSDTYFQSALILQNPKDTAKLAKELANKIKENNIKVNAVVSPAVGGIVIGYEVARALGVRSIFTERVDGKVGLRRSFSVDRDEKVLVVEDVITTGLSSIEVINSVKSMGSVVVAVASLVDRSAGKVDFGVPKFSILTLEVKNYDKDSCPMCKSGSVAIKPGRVYSISI